MGISGSGDRKMISCGEGAIFVGVGGEFATLLEGGASMYAYIWVCL